MIRRLLINLWVVVGFMVVPLLVGMGARGLAGGGTLAERWTNHLVGMWFCGFVLSAFLLPCLFVLVMGLYRWFLWIQGGSSSSATDQTGPR